MKKIIIAIIILLVVGGVIGTVVKTRDGKSAEATVEKKVEVVKRGDFQMRISATGNLEPLLSVEVKSNVEGEIIRLNVDEGDVVEAGQVLLEIDPEQIVEDKVQAEANVDAAKAQFRKAELNLELKKAQLQSQLKQARDNLQISKARVDTTQATSKSQLTQAETNIRTTENSLQEDKIALEQAKIALSKDKLTLAELEAEKESAQVTLDTTKADLDRTKELFSKSLVAKKAVEDAERAYSNAVTQNQRAEKRFEAQEQTVLSQEQTIRARAKAIETREATLDYQNINLEQLRSMRKADEEEAALQLQIAQTRLNEIELTLNQEEVVSQQETVSANASLLQQQSRLKNQQERLSWTTVKAPMAGTITLLDIEEGEIVTSGRSAFSQSPPLMTIADLSKMVVKTYINEVDMERLRFDQRAEIKLDAYENKVYDGRVAEISPSGQERDNIISFEVIIEVVGSPQELRPGMSADVDIITYEEKDVLLLPLDAVKEDRSTVVTADIGNDTSQFKEGQDAGIKTSGGKIFDGTVTSISGGMLTISIDSSQRGLRPGRETVTLLADGKEKADGVVANIKMNREKYVTLDDGGSSDDKEPSTGRRTPVETGMQNPTDVIITSGLRAGDRIILPSRQSSGGPGGRR